MDQMAETRSYQTIRRNLALASSTKTAGSDTNFFHGSLRMGDREKTQAVKTVSANQINGPCFSEISEMLIVQGRQQSELSSCGTCIEGFATGHQLEHHIISSHRIFMLNGNICVKEEDISKLASLSSYIRTVKTPHKAWQVNQMIVGRTHSSENHAIQNQGKEDEKNFSIICERGINVMHNGNGHLKDQKELSKGDRFPELKKKLSEIIHFSEDKNKQQGRVLKCEEFNAKLDEGNSKDVSLPPVVFVCPQCREEYTSLREIRFHVRFHGVVLCVECGTYCVTISGLMEHSALKIHDDLHPCYQCGLGLQTKEELMEHSVLHGLSFSINSDKFNRENYEFFEFLKIMLSEDLERMNITPIDKETESVESIQNKSQLILKGNEGAYPNPSLTKRISVCLVCREVCIGEESYKKHIARQHCTAVTPSREKMFTCIVCKALFKSEALMVDHKRKSHESAKNHTYVECYPYKCRECHKRFTTAGSLKRHLNLHEDFPCKLCHKAFCSQSELDEHIGNMHLTQNLPKAKRIKRKYTYILCEICGHKCISQSALAEHKATHIEERKFACGLCDKRFKTISRCKQHIRQIHSDRKRFQCEKCPKAFKSISDLNLHMRFHNNIRPHPCQTCGKAFHTRQNMKVHQQRCKGKSDETVDNKIEDITA